MSKKTNILVINGRKYDYRTGVLLETPEIKEIKHTKPTTKAKVVSKPTKPETKASVKPRHKSNNVDPHAPTKSKTLMRKVVAKPSKSLKRQTKAQSHVSGVRSHSASHTSNSITTTAKKIDNRLSSYAKKVHKSPLIQRFSPSDKKPAPIVAMPTPKPVAKKPAAVKYTSKRKPQTTAELLEYAISQATSHEQPAPKKKSRNPLKRKA